jgi:hypothetical protein
MEAIHRRMTDEAAAYRRTKAARVRRGTFGELDHANCWYCLKHFGKVAWLSDRDAPPWSEDLKAWERTPTDSEAPGAFPVGSVVFDEMRWRPHPDAETVPVAEDEGILVHVGTGLSYRLNRTAMRIWEGVRSGRDLGTIARELTGEFDVEEAVARERIGGFATELQRLGFVTPDGPQQT